MKKAHIVTGGTGFVGLGLILELLRQTTVDIVCLVRSGKEPADTRLYRLLHEAALAYGYDTEILQAIPQRCHAIEGDVRKEHCGVHGTFPYEIEQFWHSAASLQHEEKDATHLLATNVEGTKHALALARQCGATAFNYISTAYVAGQRSGTILEALESGHETSNFYEQTKIQAEAIVSQVTDMHVRIFRPSAVIGHSKTYAVVGSFTGIYGIMRHIHIFKSVYSKKMANGQDQMGPMAMCVDPTLGINLIPIDWVTTQAIQCATSSSPATIFHLTNSTPPPVGLFLQHAFGTLNLPRPIFVESTDKLSARDTQFANFFSFFLYFMMADQLFDRTNTDQTLGRVDAGHCVMESETLEAFCRWYLPHLQRRSKQHTS